MRSRRRKYGRLGAGLSGIPVTGSLAMTIAQSWYRSLVEAVRDGDPGLVGPFRSILQAYLQTMRIALPSLTQDQLLIMAGNTLSAWAAVDNCARITRRLAEAGFRLHQLGPWIQTRKWALSAQEQHGIYLATNRCATGCFLRTNRRQRLPAVDVVITDQLDIVNIDLSTMRLGPISFGGTHLLPNGSVLSSYTATVDLRPAKNLLVKITAGLNKTTGLLTWSFTSLDRSLDYHLLTRSRVSCHPELAAAYSLQSCRETAL